MPRSELIRFLSPEFDHADERGSLIQLASSGWSQINLIRSTAGSIRGGHFHQHRSELFYVVDGEFDLTLSTPTARQTVRLSPGHMFVIPPLVAHTFTFLASSTLIGLYDEPVTLSDGTLDIVKGDPPQTD